MRNFPNENYSYVARIASEFRNKKLYPKVKSSKQGKSKKKKTTQRKTKPQSPPNNSSPISPPAATGGSFSLPTELTYQAIEQAVILNMYNPDKERTSAINLARQLLETKEKMAILSKESDEIYSQLTKLDSSELRLFVKPNHDYSSTSSENSMPSDSFEDN